MGLKRDLRVQEGVSDPRGEGLFTGLWMHGVAVSITTEAVSMFLWVLRVARVGRKVFRIQEGRACLRAHTFVLWLSPLVPRLWVYFGGSQPGPEWAGRCFGSERGGLALFLLRAWCSCLHHNLSCEYVLVGLEHDPNG